MPDKTLKNYGPNLRILDGGGISLDRALPYQLKLDEYGGEHKKILETFCFVPTLGILALPFTDLNKVIILQVGPIQKCAPALPSDFVNKQSLN